MEWLALVIDAPLVILAIFFYIFKLHDIGKTLDSEELLYKIADSVEEFVKDFIQLFHSRNTLFFGISAILVLHLITDVGAFLLPYIFGTENLYNIEEDYSHKNIIELFLSQREEVTTISDKLLLLAAYILNIIGILSLMLYPSFIWFVLYKNKISKEKFRFNPPEILTSLGFSSLVYVFYIPLFKVTYIPTSTDNIIGVDIQTIPLALEKLKIGFILAFLIFASVYLLSKLSIKLKVLFFKVITLVSLAFFGYYILNYYWSVMLFYINFLKTLFYEIELATLYIFVINIVFFIIITFFYIGGYIIYLQEFFSKED